VRARVQRLAHQALKIASS